MIRLSSWLRYTAFVLSCLQLIWQGALPVADALEGARGQEFARSHIEAPATHHAHIHTDDCEICQLLSGGILPLPDSPAVVVPSAVVAATARAADSLLPGAGASPILLPRAPPLPIPNIL